RCSKRRRKDLCRPITIISMEVSLEQLVRRRAEGHCEYCRMPEAWDTLPFHMDHIVAQQHGGKTVASNLALAFYTCNLQQGSNLCGIDPITRKITSLFHPRRHKWGYHFCWNGALLEGRTAIGRTTINVLGVNLKHRVDVRGVLMELRAFPLE